MTRTLLRATAMLALLSTSALAQTVSGGPAATATSTGASSSTPGTVSGTNTYVINPDGTFAFGAQGDAAWSGTGNGSGIAISKALYGLLAGTLKTQAQGNTPITAASLPLPAGAASAANQVPGVAPGAAATLAEPVQGVGGGPVSVAGNVGATTSPLGVTTTQSGGTTSATQGTFTTLAAALAARLGCTLQNTSAGTIYLYYGTASSPSATNSFQIGSGQTSTCNPGGLVLRDQIQIGASIASASYVLALQ